MGGQCTNMVSAPEMLNERNGRDDFHVRKPRKLMFVRVVDDRSEGLERYNEAGRLKEPLDLLCRPGDTVGELKAQIERNTGIPTADQRLAWDFHGYKGVLKTTTLQNLEDGRFLLDHLTLQEYKIHPTEDGDDRPVTLELALPPAPPMMQQMASGPSEAMVLPEEPLMPGERRIGVYTVSGWDSHLMQEDDGKWHARVPNPMTMGGYYRGTFDTKAKAEAWMQKKKNGKT